MELCSAVAPWSFVCGMFKARSILCSVEVAEALAVSNGLSFAADVGISRFYPLHQMSVKRDSKITVDTIHHDSGNSFKRKCYFRASKLEECRMPLNGFQGSLCTHISRSGHFVAHSFARFALAIGDFRVYG